MKLAIVFERNHIMGEVYGGGEGENHDPQCNTVHRKNMQQSHLPGMGEANEKNAEFNSMRVIQ